MPIGDLMAGLAELADAADAYVEAEQYYEGDPPEWFMSTRVQRLLSAAGTRKLNMAKIAVNTVAARLRVSSVAVEGNDAATKVIEKIAKANDLDLHAPNWFRRALEYGDAYVVVWPFVDGSEESDDVVEGVEPNDLDLDGEQTDAGVEIAYASPLAMRVIYDVERPNRKLYAVMRWEEPGEDGQTRIRANVYYADRIERWVTGPGAKGRAREEWQQYEDGDVENPYGEIPVFHFRTDAPYGYPEHADAFSPADALNKLFATQLGSTEFAGFPQRYALTDPDAILNQANDDPDWDDDADAPDTDGSAPASSSLRGGPGTMVTLNGIKQAGQWDPADPGVFSDPFSLYTRVMAQITTTPLHYFDPAGGTPSGESLRAADAPLGDKVRDRKTWFGSALKELWRFALKVAGVELGPDEEIAVEWTPPAVATDADSWNVAKLKVEAGVPTRQVLIEQGYTPEQVGEWMEDEDPERLALQARVGLLVQIGEAVKSLGAGIGFGVLSKENANAIIYQVLGEIISGVTLEVPEPEPAPEPLGMPLPGADDRQRPDEGKSTPTTLPMSRRSSAAGQGTTPTGADQRGR